MRIYLHHMRQMPLGGRTGYCARGARAFAEHYGLDWDDFCQHGIEAEVLLATGDYQAEQVVEFARQQEGGQ